MATKELIGYINWMSIMECTVSVTPKDGEAQIIPFDMGDNAENYRRWVGFISREAKLVLENDEVKDMQPIEEPEPPAPTTT